MDGKILPNKEKKRSKMSWWNQKFTVKGKKKRKQNGLTKPKGYCRGIGAFYIVNRNNIT